MFSEADFAVHRVKEEDIYLPNRKMFAFRTVLLTSVPLIVDQIIVIRHVMVKAVP